MVRNSIVALTVALGMFLFTGIGCANFQKGETVVKYSKGDPARMSEAPEDGTYALFSGTDIRNAQIEYTLKAGDPLGFTQDDNGQVWAVAGTHRDKAEIGTMTKSYFWRKVK